MNFRKSAHLLLVCISLSIMSFVACNKSGNQIESPHQLTPKFKIDGDTVVVDTTIVIDTLDVEGSTRLDSACFRNSSNSFRVYAKFSGIMPDYVWIKVGTNWYGPVPAIMAVPPNTYVYESTWFNQLFGNIVASCLWMKFTYTTNFNSPHFIMAYVCRCR